MISGLKTAWSGKVRNRYNTSAEFSRTSKLQALVISSIPCRNLKDVAMRTCLIIFITLSFSHLSYSQFNFGVINPKLGIQPVEQIFFTSEDIGYGIGTFGKFCKTIDGGMTWMLIYTDTLTVSYRNFASLFFVNDSTGYLASADGKLFKTKDGGVSLTEIYRFPATPYDNPYMYFSSDSSGIIPNRGKIHTTNQLNPRFAIQALRNPHELNRHHITCNILGSQTPAAIIHRAKINH